MRLFGKMARAALVLLAATILLAGPARAASAQEPEPTDPEPANPAPTQSETSTTLADLDTPTAPVREAPLTESERASRTIQWVVIGLLVLAALVLVVTVVFWRRTRPSRLLAQDVSDAARQRGLALTGEPAVTGAIAVPAQPPTVQPAQSQPAQSQPPTPLPTGPGSWSAFAASVGLEEAPPSPDNPASSVDEPTQAHQAVEESSLDEPSAPEPPLVIQPPEFPRPAFETASTGSWASQGWGKPQVLPEGFAGKPPAAPSWKWDERGEPHDGEPASEDADSASGSG